MTPAHHNLKNIERFLSYLKADKGYSILTIRAYQSDLMEFMSFVQKLEGNLEWKDVDMDIVRRWIVKCRENGLSPRSVKRGLSSIRSFYKYMMMMGEVDKNPARMVRNPKEDKPLPYFLHQKEIDQLLDHTKFPENFEGERDRLIILTFYSTGIRRAELIGLNIEDIVISNSEMRVIGKRNKQRIIPFGQELSQAITHYLHSRKEYLTDINFVDPTTNRAFFISKKGGRINEIEVNTIVKKYLSIVTQQKRRSPHILRHTFATAMLNNGADIRAVQELLGHESLKTTEIYTHTTLTELKEIYAKAHPCNKRGNISSTPPHSATDVKEENINS